MKIICTKSALCGQFSETSRQVDEHTIQQQQMEDMKSSFITGEGGKKEVKRRNYIFLKIIYMQILVK